MKKEQAIKILEDLLSQITLLRTLPHDSQKAMEWRYNTGIALEKIFLDDGGSHKKNFESFFFAVFVAGTVSNSAREEAYQKYLNSEESLLKSIVKEIRDWAFSDNKKLKEDTRVIVEPKPPEILQNILWIRQNWKKYWDLLLIGLVLLIASGIFVLPKVDFFSNLFNSQKEAPKNEFKTYGGSSPAINTSGPNSPVNFYMTPNKIDMLFENNELDVSCLKKYSTDEESTLESIVLYVMDKYGSSTSEVGYLQRENEQLKSDLKKAIDRLQEL
ncbi:MAG: hypothetical protein EHM87_25410, partial [Burkholderiales bacterium]